jgi:O-antigen/teichoic acid export membrane protein
VKVTREATLVAYRAFSDVAGKGAFFIVTVLAARRLSQDAFGVFSLGTTLGWMAAVATDAGIQLHLARAVARSPDRASALLRTWLRVRLWTAFVALAAVVLVLALTGAAGSFALAILLFVTLYIVSGLVEFLHYYYRGLSRSDLESTLTLGQRFGTLACAALALAWLPDVTTLAAAMLVPMAITFGYSLRQAFRLASLPSSSAPGFDLAESVSRRRSPWLEMRSDIMPIGIGIVLSALYFRIDVFLLQIWSGTGAVALYNAVFRLVEALRLFPAAVMAVALPTLCRATSARPLLGVSAVVTSFSFVVALGLWFAADPLVPLVYGEQYADAVPAFQILVASFPLMSLNYALTHQLIGWNGHRAYAVICAGALVFNVALNARLIPEMSIAGAAWSTFWTEALLAAACAVTLWSRRASPTSGDHVERGETEASISSGPSRARSRDEPGLTTSRPGDAVANERGWDPASLRK